MSQACRLNSYHERGKGENLLPLVVLHGCPSSFVQMLKTTTGRLLTLKNLFSTLCEWAERSYRVDRWTDAHRGRHFLEWEEPELVAEDVRTLFRPLRQEGVA